MFGKRAERFFGVSFRLGGKKVFPVSVTGPGKGEKGSPESVSGLGKGEKGSLGFV